MKKIFIVGPTASGKSRLAHELAQKIGGEIVCADSQTVRRGLDIGAAKPTEQEQAEVPHHMLDIIDPYEPFSVAEYVRLARAAIDDIIERGKVPIIVGGTGLYVDALFYGFSFDGHNDEYKKKLQKKTVKELQDIIIENGYPFPENKENPRHLIGVILRGGASAQDNKPIEDAYKFGISIDENALKKRIGDRTEQMFQDGVIEEARSLFERYGRPEVRMDAIVYPILLRLMDGDINEDEAKQLCKRSDWQYARRQKSWLRRDRHVHWLQPGSDMMGQVMSLL